MIRKALLLLFALTFSIHLNAAEKVTLATRVEGLKKQDGFFPWYWDEKKGTILLELSSAALSHEFLYFTALGSGIGSTEVFADRSSFAGNALCRFRRVGGQVLIIQENTAFFAQNGGADLKQSVESSFPTSVLAALPLEAEQDGTLLVDASHLLIRDAVDLLSQLKRPTQVVGGAMVRTEGGGANWRLDETRSVIDQNIAAVFQRTRKSRHFLLSVAMANPVSISPIRIH